MSHMTTPDDPLATPRAAVRARLESDGLHPLAARTGVAIGRIRSVSAGRDPHGSTISALCRALGLELYIGPPRRNPKSANEGVDSQIRGPGTGDVEPIRDRHLTELLARLADGWEMSDTGERERLAAAIAASLDLAGAKEGRHVAAFQVSDTTVSPPPVARKPAPPDYAESPAVAITSDPSITEPREAYVTMPWAQDARTAAGSGEMVFEESTDLRLAVRQSALSAWARHDALMCLRAEGGSMHPTLRHGDLLAIDPTQLDPIDGQIYVLRGVDGLAVKRLRHTSDGWMAISDHSDWPPRALGADDHVVGRVAWSGPPPRPEERD